MVPVMSLWLPIVLSAIVVFVVSFLIHMVLGYHRKDFRPVSNEAAVLDVLRTGNIAPGQYMLPAAKGPADMKSPEFIEKMKRGPVVIITAREPSPPAMGSFLVQWLIYCAVVSLFAGYVTSRAVGPGTDYLQVFRFASTVAFVGFAVALWQDFIWYARPLRNVLLQTFDSVVLAVL